MAEKPLTDAESEALRLRAGHPSIRAAAKAAGMDESVLRRQLNRAEAKGEKPDLPDLPKGYVAGKITVQTANGKVERQWTRASPSRNPMEIVDVIKASFDGIVGAKPSHRAPVASDTDLLTLVPLSDWHIGLYGWKNEVGVNWDLDIAEQTIGAGIEDLIERTPTSSRAVVLGGGDLLHSDNAENRTSRSGHPLDVDGRWPKVLMTANRLVVRTIDACLRRHDKVTVRILRGNHDEHSSVAVAYFLLAWYRNEPRVEVDVDPSLFWWFRFGKVLLGATHGHETRIKDMASVMAHRRAADWGASNFRYVHGFHLHHSAKIATEGGGVISEIHQTPAPQDAWHFGSGFLSGRSMQAITYHSDFGEIARTRAAILDHVCESP